jgi:hypothetical protein
MKKDVCRDKYKSIPYKITSPLSSHFLSRKETKLMGKYNMGTFKQFSLEERITIQNVLDSRKSFKAIARQLGKAPSSNKPGDQEAHPTKGKRRLWRTVQRLCQLFVLYP